MPRLLSAILLVLMAHAAQAMSLRELRALEKSGTEGLNHSTFYLVGAMEGVLHAHNEAVRRGAAPTICVEGRALEPHMARSLFDTERKRNAELYEADMPVTLVLANALATVYPCS